MKRYFLLMLAAIFLMMTVAGCNTMGGFGTDMKNAGKNIENAGK